MRVGWAILVLVGCAAPPPARQTLQKEPAPNPDAIWPWPGVTEEPLTKGLKRWMLTDTSDGSTVELIEINLHENKDLRFEIYDQDHHDEVPYDDKTDYYGTNISQVTQRVNKSKDRQVVLASNGLFHGYLRGPGTPSQGLANHIGLTVSRGVVRYNVGSPRWAFGAKSIDGRQVFDVALTPNKKEIGEKFDEAAVGAQLLVRNGKALRIPPIRQLSDPPLPRPVPTGPEDAGHIPQVDFWRTSRVSIGWTNDSSKLYFLFVNERDNELQSKLVATGRMDAADGGWTLRDLQNFWLKFGVDNAINSDGGMIAQWNLLLADGTYELQPPRWEAPPDKIKLKPDFSNAPTGGGTLMSFVITRPKKP